MTVYEMTLVAELVESSWGATGGRSLTFAYDSDEPLSVFVRRLGGDYEFGRELLREALERTTAGYGDVRFLNHGISVFMHFNTPSGYATYVLDRGDLRAFLRATQRVCEFGAEAPAIPDDVSALLKDGAR